MKNKLIQTNIDSFSPLLPFPFTDTCLPFHQTNRTDSYRGVHRGELFCTPESIALYTAIGYTAHSDTKRTDPIH